MSSFNMTDNLKRLASHFSDPDDQASRWDELWAGGDFLPWDHAHPQPALADVMSKGHELLGSAVVPADPSDPSSQGRRKRALVPGCGRGYDVLFLASCGYDAYGLEVSPSAIEACKQYEREHGAEYPARDEKIGRGQVHFILGDFFKDDWLRGVDGPPTFDFIFDYTVSLVQIQG